MMSRRLWHWSRFVQNLVERLAPFKRGGVRRRQNRLQDPRYIVELNVLAIKLFRRAQGEVLDQQPIDFVAIDTSSCSLFAIAVE